MSPSHPAHQAIRIEPAGDVIVSTETREMASLDRSKA
jgi:hypothetical protein